VRWWLAYLVGVIVLAVVNDWSHVFVRALMLGSFWVVICCLLVDAFLLRSARLGSVRRNKRALHSARKDLANGEGGWLRVQWLRIRLFLALRARKSL
jgi:hypothetical protein